MAQTWTARLRDIAQNAGRIFDRAPPRKPRTTADPTGRVTNDLPLYLQLRRIGGNLTPAQVTDILRDADNGRMYRIVDLANEMRQKDCHLQGCLETLETDLSGLEWQIEPVADATKEEIKAADFLQKTFEAMDEVPSLVAHLSGGFLNSHAVSETLLEKDGGYIVPVGFEFVNARRFCYELTKGRLQWWDQAGGLYPYPGVDFMATWPGKFIAFTPRVVGDVQCREGLQRPLMWAALFRNWDTRDWLKLAELAWQPWRVGKYSRAANEEDIYNLENVLRNMTAGGIAVVPTDADVTIEWPGNLGPAGSPHGELFDVFGREMSKAILGTTTTVELGKHGNQSASKTGEHVEAKKLAARSRRMAGCLRAHLLTPLVRMNFGDGVRVPTWRFNTDDIPDLLSFGQGVSALVGAGFKTIPASHLHDKLGIPRPLGFTDYTLAAPVAVKPGEDGKKPGEGDSSGKPGSADKPTEPAPKKPAAGEAD